MKIKQLFEETNNDNCIGQSFLLSGFVGQGHAADILKLNKDRIVSQPNLRIRSFIPMFEGSDKISFLISVYVDNDNLINETDKICQEWMDNIKKLPFLKNCKIEKEDNSFCYLKNMVPSTLVNFKVVRLIVDKDTSLHDIHKKVNCKFLELAKLQYITDSVLGLLKIKDLKRIDLDSYDRQNKPKWFEIINNHLANKDILACHEELVDNGLEDYAQL